jgi:hypothetical protein
VFDLLRIDFGTNVPSLCDKRKSLCHAPAPTLGVDKAVDAGNHAASVGIKACSTNSRKVPSTATEQSRRFDCGHLVVVSPCSD